MPRHATFVWGGNAGAPSEVAGDGGFLDRARRVVAAVEGKVARRGELALVCLPKFTSSRSRR